MDEQVSVAQGHLQTAPRVPNKIGNAVAGGVYVDLGRPGSGHCSESDFPATT